MQQQGRRQHRQQRHISGKGQLPGQEARDQQQQQTQAGARHAQQATGGGQQGQGQRQEHTRQELPEPRQGIEVGALRVLLGRPQAVGEGQQEQRGHQQQQGQTDRKSTRLNSSHVRI